MKDKMERQLIAEIESLRKEVAELKQKETEHREAEHLYTALANSSQIGVYIVQNRKFQFVSPRFQEYTDFSQDELLGMDSLNIVHPEDREMVRENAVKKVRAGKAQICGYCGQEMSEDLIGTIQIKFQKL